MALITVFVNIYTAQDGDWSVTAMVSICIIGVYGVTMSASILWYQYGLLPSLQDTGDGVVKQS